MNLQIQNIEEAEAALRPYVPLVAQLTGKDTTLERIVPLMHLLGDPQDKLRVIHIAGTSGKTSTAYFIAALLQSAGKTVGLTVSPHVDSVTERVQLNGKPLSESEFCEELAAFLDIVERAEMKPSYFELLYAFAVWVFARRQVDYAVVETGMGGLFDATNVITRSDKVCVITDIGFDHMHVLGHTLNEIAAQKAGIIHEHNPAFMYEQSEEVMQVVRDWAAAHDAPLSLTTEEREREAADSSLFAMPEYQQRNWLLAYYVYRAVAERDGLADLTAEQLASTQKLQVPARMDVQVYHDKRIIMDGAHNEQKMTAFVTSFKHAYPNVKPAFLVSFKQGKEYEQVAPLIVPLASRIIATTFDTSQDLPAKSVDPEELAAAFRRAGAQQVTVEPDQHRAFESLVSGDEPACVITGSFYLISQLRQREQIV